MHSTARCSTYIRSRVKTGLRNSLSIKLIPSFAAPILSLPPALQDLLKTLFDETIKWMEEIGDQDDGSSSMVASLQHNLQSLTAEYVRAHARSEG